MEEIKTKGIVIKSIDYKDSDKIVTIFSCDLGLIKARVRGVKKDKAKLAFAVQPFAFVEFLLVKSNDFYTCINATSIDQFYNIVNDFDNYIFMVACLEICEKTIKENSPEPNMFLLLIESLKAVCYKKTSSMFVFIKFVLVSLKFLGFAFELEKCSICGKQLSNKYLGFSFETNGIVCENCSTKNDNLALSVGEYAILNNINLTKLNALSNLKFSSRNDLISVIGLLCKVFRILTDEEIETIKKFL